MTRISGIGGGAAPSRRTVRSAGSFTLAAPQPGAPATQSAPAAPALLALQQGAAGPAPAEARASRRAAAALDVLRELQLEMLGIAGAPDRLARLAALAETWDRDGHIADPALRGMLAEIGLRLRVELARRRAGLATSG